MDGKVFKDRKIVRVAALVTIAAVLIPHHNYPVGSFELPITSLGGQIAIAIAVVALFVPTVEARKRQTVVLVAVLGSILAFAGSVILFSNPSGGFQACYRVMPTEDGENTDLSDCDKSYTAPFAKNMTRSDPIINFGSKVTGEPILTVISETNWNLSEINSLEYNFFNEGEPSRLRLPFVAGWKGQISASSELRVMYVGSGSIRLDNEVTNLPLNYGDPAQIEIKNSSGGDLAVQFAWSPGVSADSPFALLSITDRSGIPIQARDSSWQTGIGLVVTLFLWAALVALSFLILFFLKSTKPIKRMNKKWGLMAALLPGVAIASIFLSQQSSGILVLIPISLLLFLVTLGVHLKPAANRVIAALAISGTAILTGISTGRSVDSLTYRDGGGDFLTYESFARTILTTGSLQAGEDTFVYSPAIRYWVYIQHLIFGDGDYLIYVLSLGVLLASTWFVTLRFVVNPLNHLRKDGQSLNSPPVWLGFAATAILGSLIGSTFMWNAAYVLLSEYPTWPLLGIALTMALTSINQPRQLLIVGALLGLALTFRGNQLPGIAAIAIFALVRATYPVLRNRNIRGALFKGLFLLSPFSFFALLPGLHNFSYGGRWIPLQTSLPLPVNFPLPPGRLLDIGIDPLVRETVKSQLQGLFVFTDQIYFSPFTVTIRIIQLAFIVLIALSIFHRFRGPWRSSLMIFFPFMFLLPHLFIQVYVYYPRHIVAGYFTGAIVLMAIAGIHISSKSSNFRSGLLSLSPPSENASRDQIVNFQR